MTDKQQADFQARLQKLRQAYTAALPAKLDNIDEQWQKLSSSWDWDTGETLHRLVHGLAGSGGSFGYAQLGTQAREIEIELKPKLQNRQIPDKKQWAELVKKLKALRQAIQEAPTKDTTSFRATATAPSGEETDKQRIYILEDDPAITRELALQLEHFGYEASTFDKVKAMDSAISQETPDAVIVDIVLPEGPMAGVDMVRDIRARHGQTLPVIFISVRNDFEARLEAARAGGDAYFVKPLEIAPLIDRIDGLTQKQIDPYRILIIDDDENLANHYALILNQAGMEATAITHPEEAMEAMTSVRPELILLDIYMSACSGLELAKIVRQQDTYLGIPIVFLSSETNLEKQSSAMRMGGDDFLTKPIEDKRLISSVAIRAERARTLNNLMVQDSLTGLLKHTKIKEQLALEVSRAKREETSLAYAMIDIDHFKDVNDTYGHLSGDHVIKALARLLKQRLRQSDYVGRYGGEEFAVILPNCNIDAAAELIEQLRLSFEKLCFLHDGKEFSVTFSAGIAIFPQHKDPEKLSQHADQALYQAKRAGRNRIVTAGPHETSGITDI